MKTLLTVKSSECIDLLSKLHTSKPYNKIGKHFVSVTALGLPQRPTYQLWQKYYSQHERGPFGLINGTFKFVCSHNENTQVSDFTQSSSRPFSVLILEQTFSCLAPIRIQDDFLTLVTISIE